MIEVDGGAVLLVADGAGGVSGGGRAADKVADLVRCALQRPGLDLFSSETWRCLLKAADTEIALDRTCGETAAVVAAVSEVHGIHGACSGDSECWVVAADGSIDDLTQNQRRKLRLGSGMAVPIGFDRERVQGRLLAATDGLFKYLSPDSIVESAQLPEMGMASSNLVEMLKTRKGGLMDDAAFALVESSVKCRESSPPSTKHNVPDSVAERGFLDEGNRLRLRILYVEDHLTFAATVAEQFLSRHDVVVAPGVAAAREEIANSERFDVVLLDYDLPDGKGTEILPLLLNRGYRGKVVAVSGRDEGNDELLRAGASAVCKKARFTEIDAVLRRTAR